MKTNLILSTLTIAFAFSASATSSKICFGTGDSKGEHFTIVFSQKTAKISEASGQSDWLVGSFPRVEDVLGRNGTVYVNYDLGSNDGSNNLLADENLLDNETTGYVKIRNRGEGYSQSVYFCKDNQ